MIEKHSNYIDFINAWISQQPKQGYGVRSQLAQHLDVKTSYISQILSGSVILKEEHAIAMVDFFKLDELESDYFLALVALERAGTHKLKQYYKEKVSSLKKELKKVIRTSKEDEDRDEFEKYFSSWMYVALHLLSSLKAIDAKIIAQSMGLSVEIVEPILQYLTEAGFLVKNGDLYQHSNKDIYIPKGHKWLNQHHANWRIKAIDKTQVEHDDNLHYTSVMSCSKKDAEEFKSKMREMIKDFTKKVKTSEGEVVCCYTMDFFSVFDGL